MSVSYNNCCYMTLEWSALLRLERIPLTSLPGMTLKCCLIKLSVILFCVCGTDASHSKIRPHKHDFRNQRTNYLVKAEKVTKLTIHCAWITLSVCNIYLTWNVNSPCVSNLPVLGTLQNTTNWQLDYGTKILLKHTPTIKIIHINKHTVTVCSKLYLIT